MFSLWPPWGLPPATFLSPSPRAQHLPRTRARVQSPWTTALWSSQWEAHHLWFGALTLFFPGTLQAGQMLREAWKEGWGFEVLGAARGVGFCPLGFYLP